MGGHGAISLYLEGVSDSGEVKRPWGDKGFKGCLKGDLEGGKAHDATELITKAKRKSLHILADYGTADNFYKQGQLLPGAFVVAAKDARFRSDAVNMRKCEGYDTLIIS
ncbi:S-formylglutathione hydrolase [Ceratobasidium theobromae]|uniref:S-formylglutathione hydrolase n=1 Tax=Ceratobasidium theobromae TaxID=1582974 RepID=A0A5N5Q779_9AGAM|nr:S-formylglutathione hydrolase [Ceratobasidium theobromae]